jgi:hypothetical protein
VLSNRMLTQANLDLWNARRNLFDQALSNKVRASCMTPHMTRPTLSSSACDLPFPLLPRPVWWSAQEAGVPSDAVAWCEQVRALYELGRYEEAVKAASLVNQIKEPALKAEVWIVLSLIHLSEVCES